jgi:hypothetical protein
LSAKNLERVSKLLQEGELKQLEIDLLKEELANLNPSKKVGPASKKLRSTTSLTTKKITESP